jgi:hypothetical protein
MNLPQVKVTAFENLFEKTPVVWDIGHALQRIQKGKSRVNVEAIRLTGDKEIKKRLPVVLFSGVFTERRDDAIHDHSSFIVVDIDHCDVDATKSALCMDEHIFACWRSPSGDGVKALVRVSFAERHRDHFRALMRYFERQYGLEIDPSGINESRACFESYDPDICIKENFKTFSAMLSDKSDNQAVKKEQITDYMKLNLAARMIRNAEDGQKHKMLYSASRLCGGYVAAGRIEEEEAIRVLYREVLKKEPEDAELAKRTIIEGIESGKKLPIREVVEEENKIQREMLINDGDMSFISAGDDDFKWIDDFAMGKVELGLDTGNEQLDKFFRYKKEFVIINGHSNVGKTTFALYMMVNASIRHGWKWLVYSSENKTASIKMKLMQFVADRKINNMTYHERKFVYRWVNDHFTIIDNSTVYSFYDLIIFGEKVLRERGFDGFLVDPYNSLRIDMSDRSNISAHEYHYEAASEFLTFSNRNNVALWLNTHSVTESQRVKGEDGLSVAPWAESTEGGSKFVNRADCFVTFHRKIQSPDPIIRKTMEFHVRKQRETETGGQPTPYDEPIRFEITPDHTGFYGQIGGQLYKGVFDQSKNNEVYLDFKEFTV